VRLERKSGSYITFPGTNLAQTYKDPLEISTCPSNAQVIAPGTTTCSATSDAAGNFAFIANSSTNVVYYFKYQSTWYGPFVQTLGGAGGSGGLNGTNAKTANYTLLSTDNGKNVTFNCSSCTATLQAVPPSGVWAVFIQNRNASVLTISPSGLQIDGSASSISLMQNQGVFISTDGTNYFTSRGADNPLGVAAGSVLASQGVGTPPVYQGKATIDVRDDAGIEC
jgi:hypothetical protein